MRSRTVRSAVAVFATAAVTAGLAACGGGDSGGSSGGGGTNGAGKTLDVYISANTQFPKEFAAWQQDIASQFKTQTGATVKFETFASRQRRAHQDPDVGACPGKGPDIYALGTTFTPTAYATGRVRQARRRGRGRRSAGKDKFLPATLGISGPDANNQVGIPFASRPFVMAYNKDLLKAAGIDKPATTWDGLRPAGQEADQRRQLRARRRLQGRLRPVEVHLGDVASRPATRWSDGKTAKIDDPTVKKAYQTYFGWLATDKVVEPGRGRLEERPGHRGVRQGQGGYFADDDADQPMPTLDKRPSSRASGPTR